MIATFPRVKNRTLCEIMLTETGTYPIEEAIRRLPLYWQRAATIGTNLGQTKISKEVLSRRKNTWNLWYRQWLEKWDVVEDKCPLDGKELKPHLQKYCLETVLQEETGDYCSQGQKGWCRPEIRSRVWQQKDDATHRDAKEAETRP